MNLDVAFTPRALRHLDAIFDYIAEHGDPVVARNYVRRLEEACRSLGHLPKRGVSRDELRPGLRILPFKRSATIVFSIEKAGVIIHGVFKAGQDYEAIIRETPDVGMT